VFIDVLSSIVFLIAGVILIYSSHIAMAAYLSFFITRLINLILSIIQQSVTPRSMIEGLPFSVLTFKTLYNAFTLLVALGILLAKGLEGFAKAELIAFIIISLFGLFLSIFHHKLSNEEDRPVEIILPIL